MKLVFSQWLRIHHLSVQLTSFLSPELGQWLQMRPLVLDIAGNFQADSRWILWGWAHVRT